jgi:hypothetical protein
VYIFAVEKQISDTYSERVFVALGIRHASYFHLWSVRINNIFRYCLIKGTILEESS